MSGPLRDLERRLLVSPFDREARLAYAQALADAGEMRASLEQWVLLIQQDAARAVHHLGAARCYERLGEAAQAREALLAARACPDFDPALESDVQSAPQRVAMAPLRAIPGGRRTRDDNVVPLSRSDRVRFADIVGMVELKKLVRLRIVDPFLNPGLFARFKKRSGGGVMLYGPPGCGKTLLARAIANECQASFTAIGISDILNTWLGESERSLAAIFDKARSEAPAVLFFDELDALAFSRSKARSDHTRTLVNEFLNQLDGMSGRNDKVLVLAATNMPWDVDDAMKRPGRFDRQVFVPPPDAAGRADMFRSKLSDVPHEPLDERALAATCEHFSGADIDGIIDAAKDAAIADIMSGSEDRRVSRRDLELAVSQAQPSTLDWLKTARNLVKFGGASSAYRDVELYLRAHDLY
jgi:AAA+ superfamily predicted ATPase